MHIQWNPCITDTTGTKYFVLYSEVSFAQGVIVDHAPLTIVASYAGARLWIMKSVVLIKAVLILVAFIQESRTYLAPQQKILYETLITDQY